MSEQCLNVRRAIEEGEDRERHAGHLASCPACEAHAHLLASLERFEPREADPERVASIMASLPPAPWQHAGALAWLPLAAACVLMAVGLVLLGGVPAPGAVAAVPHVASGALAWLGTAALDSLAAIRGSADALQVLLQTQGAWLVLGLLLLVTGAGSGVRLVLRGARLRNR